MVATGFIPAIAEKIVVMRQVVNPNERKPSPAGWLVKVRHRYYTGNRRSEIECWTAIPKFAKVYSRKAWAQKMADQLGGQAVAVAEQRRAAD